MLIVLGLIAILIATLYLYLTKNFEYWARRGFLGPKPYPYVGTYPKTFLYLTATHISETTEIYWKYYRKHRFVGVFESGDPKLLILDPALITDIYVKYFRNFTENTMRELVNIEWHLQWESVEKWVKCAFAWWYGTFQISLKNDPLLRFNSIKTAINRPMSDCGQLRYDNEGCRQFYVIKWLPFQQGANTISQRNQKV